MESKQGLGSEGLGKNIQGSKLLCFQVCYKWYIPLLCQSWHCEKDFCKYSAFRVISAPALEFLSHPSRIFWWSALLPSTHLTYFQISEVGHLFSIHYQIIFSLIVWWFGLLFSAISMAVKYILDFKYMTEGCVEWR